MFEKKLLQSDMIMLILTFYYVEVELSELGKATNKWQGYAWH